MGRAEDRTGGCHHRLDGHKFAQAQGDGDGQGSLACCSPWSPKEWDTTERLNNYNNMYICIQTLLFAQFCYESKIALK